MPKDNHKNNQAARRERQAGFASIATLLAQSGPGLDLLISSSVPHVRIHFEKFIRELVGRESLTIFAETSNKQLFDNFINYVVDNMEGGQVIPPEVHQAVQKYRKNRDVARWVHWYVVDQLGLGNTSHVDTLEAVYVHKLRTPYPPKYAHISKSKAITNKWQKRIYIDPQPDRRQKRRPIHQVNKKKLQATIPADKSCRIIDADTGELIAVVLRSVAAKADGGAKGPARPGSDAAGFLDWAASAVEDGIHGRRSIRVSAPCCAICFVSALSDMHMQLEDPGKLIQTGYSAGACSKLQFDWV